MKTNHSAGLMLGIGIGSIIGAAVCCFSRTAKGKMWKKKILDAIEKMGCQAEGCAETAKERMWKVGTQAADKVADVSHNVADKADAMKERAHTAASEARR